MMENRHLKDYVKISGSEKPEICLPNFICGGAAKSGTTTLYDILKAHPDIFLSSFKEPNYFNSDQFLENDLEWYSRSYFSGYKNQKIIGDFSPAYLSIPITAKRISETLGTDVKFVFILREPVDRAYSHYLHNKRDQFEDLDFEAALAAEQERMTKAIAGGDFLLTLKYGYIDQSTYFENVKRYIDIFGSENVRVYIFEEFFNHMGDAFPELLDFLGVDREAALDLTKKSNPGSKARWEFLKKILKKDFALRRFSKKLIPSVASRTKIKNFLHKLNNKPASYEKLSREVTVRVFDRYFAGDVKKLEKLLNRDLDIWRR